MKKYTWKDIELWEPCDEWNADRFYHIFGDSASLIEIIDCEKVSSPDRIWAFCYCPDVLRKDKLLFGLNCARSVEHLMKDRRSNDALNVLEKYINGQATEEDLRSDTYAAADAAYAAAAAVERRTQLGFIREILKGGDNA